MADQEHVEPHVDCDDPICQAFGRGFKVGWKSAEAHTSSAESELRELRDRTKESELLLKAALHHFIERIECDLHEPDKLLCHIQSFRRSLLTNQETESR